MPAGPAARGGAGLPPGAVVVGTVRCGYGHHRIALALTSFASQGAPALLHDFTTLGSAPPVQMLLKLDSMYSRYSRMASDDPIGVFERIWNELMASGDATASRSMRSFCERLKPLLLDLPRDTPIISAHTFVAVTALLCGFRRVINLVFDNHAQPVHVVPPPAINLVQTPKCEQQLLEMGVPASNVRLVGHFIPKELATNVVEDTRRRMDRAAEGGCRRFLLSVGGAGAQRRLLTGLLRGLARLARELPRGLCVAVNAGDHQSMYASILTALQQDGVSVVEHRGLEAAMEFASRGDDAKTFSIFTASDPLEATGITDVLVRAADILVTKPSELAFYPLPKLHVSRIGDHEALAAVRAREHGDGTAEARSIDEAVAFAKALATQDALYVRMCKAVLRQAKAGVYNGAQRAFQMAHCDPRETSVAGEEAHHVGGTSVVL